jgi:rubredoxin
MDHVTSNAMREIMSEVEGWVKTWLESSTEVDSPEAFRIFEHKFRQDSFHLIGSIFQAVIQNAIDHQPVDRTCPHCGVRRRHKGRRRRGLLSSVGAIVLEGVYWYCPDCGGQHTVELLAPESSSRLLQELLCLLGTTLTSFAKASTVSKKVLGVTVSDATIRRLCQQHGRDVSLAPDPVEPETDVVGSCDGTMVHTRQEGWKEVKAYQFRYGDHKHGRAYLESSSEFVPRLRQGAVALEAGKAKRLFWVSDAAEWIDKGVEKQLPMAIRIIDIWHAWEHIHEASRKIYPQDEDRAAQWAQRYCHVLEEAGGRALWRRLGRVHHTDSDRQQGVTELRRYLDKNADRLNYPHYKEHGYPISSGMMESACKQLGLRIKGPGMRWNTENVTPMGNLVSLWINNEWDTYWRISA